MAKTRQPAKCALCSAPVEPGFIIDHTHGARLQQTWSAGEPQRSFWTGLKRAEREYKIAAFRCTKCGYVMEFAAPEATK